jgi:hypothetical protein
MSSAQRLPGGDTLICSGTSGFIFQVNSLGQIVWSYQQGGPGASVPVFRALRYTSDYPGVDNLP